MTVILNSEVNRGASTSGIPEVPKAPYYLARNGPIPENPELELRGPRAGAGSKGRSQTIFNFVSQDKSVMGTAIRARKTPMPV
jgi:hypothetical protein